MALPYAFRAFNGATRYSLLKPVVNASPPVPVQPSCSKATFDTHCSKRSSSCQTALSEEILYLLLFLTTFSILYIIITAKICQARISTNHAPDTFFLSEKSGCTSSAQPLFSSLYSRMPRHSCCGVRVMQLHDILLLRTSASLHSVSVGAKPLSTGQCAPCQRLYQLGDLLPPLIPACFSPPIEVGVISQLI